MLQGTNSDVGKSLLVAGLCRAYTRRGLRVLPFKAQNISTNAALTTDTEAPPGPDGIRPRGEIGRAQALQARACGVEPSIHMNPVLLKPHPGHGSQIVLRGRVMGTALARDYPAYREMLFPAVLDSLSHLRAKADLVIVEGAGSPVETHLRAGDIVNMALAEAANLPVFLVGDIDRGGVLAALIGTHALLNDAERARVRGYIINKFRGDLSLFDPACAIISDHTGWPCRGVVRWFEGASRFPAEDSLTLTTRSPGDGASQGTGGVVVVVPRLPSVANHDDLAPLEADPGALVRWIPPGRPLPRDADVIVLPGSKSTCADLWALRREGWDLDVKAHVRQGGRVVGLCGGFQMLGRVVRDPQGIEGPPGEVEGLGLLDIETEIGGDKTLSPVAATDQRTGLPVQGFEMHMGRTVGRGLDRPWFRLGGAGGVVRDEGAVSPDGRVMGTYLHGLFDSAAFRRHWLGTLGGEALRREDYQVQVEAALEALADHLEANLDLDALLAAAEGPTGAG